MQPLKACASLVALVVAGLGVVLSAQPAARRPNILFLFADDMRADTIAAHGNPRIHTPTLDDLARRGFSFREAHVFGGDSGAVCVASRAMLMTGRTLFHVQTSTMGDAPLLPEVLGKAGYATFGTGKWHNGEASWLRAFQRGRTVMFGGMSDHTKVPVKDLGADGRLTPVRVATTFSSELFADSVIDFLRSYKDPAPFFAYVAFTAPHDPRQPPAPFAQRYYDALPPLPPDFLPQFPFDNGGVRGEKGQMRDENLAPWPRPERMIREQIAEYYGMVTHLDGQIRRVLDALEATGRARDTIVVFAADNGLALGSHGLLGKQSVFEHSTRVPMIIVGPGIPAGGQSRALTYLHDLYPTLASLAGVAAPVGLDGASLQPVWQDRGTPRDSLFTVYTKTQRAVRDARWKLIAYPALGHLQLFDLQSDPHEITDLATQPARAGEIARLRALMAAWQARMGDTVPIPTTNVRPPALDLTGAPRTPDQWQPEWIVKKYFGG
ncbi:choline-sulfatase [Luteitalea sp. TBR-22]|uniref:sulfatase-like hydrolase/transferase n=1 Tax=Luteitalea sp. TBR-22 TaxID=2802971 RepID=UPI001AF8DD76|nr:sulfatase-like hydrolase/transferase [Luteitalea sp. TBR-22]BCS35893.1 choline-sulfatase [Luteitalea sp. TBR-22]